MNEAINSRLRKIYRKHTTILDLIAMTAAFTLSLLMRYIFLAAMYRNAPTVSGIYVSLLLLLLLLNFVIFNLNHDKWKVPPEQTKAEVVVTVLKAQIYLVFCLVIYLFLAKWSSKVSRSVIGFFFIFNTIFDSGIRLWYRDRIYRKTKAYRVKRRFLLVTAKSYALTLIHQLGPVQESHIRGIVLMPDLANDNRQQADTEKTAGAEALSFDAGALDPEIQLYSSVEEIPKGMYEKAFIYLPDVPQREVFHVVHGLEQRHMSSELMLTALGDKLGNKSIVTSAGYQVARYSGMLIKGKILGVWYTISNIAEAVFYVRHHEEELRGQYICFSNVHTTVMSYDHADVLAAENHAALTFPDGAPIARLLRHEADVNARRMAGPDFMEAMLRASMDGKTTHYFYGASQETLDALQKALEEKYPGLIVKGYYSPPFRSLSPEEEQEDIDRINAADADVIWIGLGAPKQEKWMESHRGKFRGVMVGVGAAFDFHAGTIKRAPKWMQLLSLEWLYRLSQNPGRLFKRYFYTNVRFLWLVALGKNR